MCSTKTIRWGIPVVVAYITIAIACSSLLNPALPPDLAKVESCIQGQAEQGVTNFVSIAVACSSSELQVGEDFVTAFLAQLLSSSWATSHVSLVSPLQDSLGKVVLPSKVTRSTDGGK
jgi:hypothetical protein